jgi:outer membrane lipoprotein-sorting protein
MKKIFFLCMALLAMQCSFAQLTHTANGNTVDENANKILNSVAVKWTTGSFKFDVTVVNLDANKKETFRQKATITYKAPCYIVKAGDIEIYCDGKTVWQVNKPSKEVVVNNMTESDDDLTNPAAMLANYQKNYRAKFIREENGTAIIDLQPKKSRPYHKIRLFIDTSNNRLKKLEQHNYDSSRGEYTFSNYTLVKVHLTAFAYTAPEGYEVVDMR